MGYALSWAAVRGGSADAVHTILELDLTGAREEVPESKVVGVGLPTGWYLVMFNRNAIKAKFLERLSLLGEVVYCFVEDHVMLSVASGWLAGGLRWSVTHDCEKGRFHLQVEGQPPPNFDVIRDRLIAQQNAEGGEKSDTDYIYDIPAELARELTGFRHDQDIPGMSGEIFQVLQTTKSRIWRLFG